MKELIFCLLIAITLPRTSISQVKNGTLSIGDTVPNIKFSLVLNHINSNFSLSDLKGKRVILDLWSKWCSSCIASFPNSEELQNEFSDSVTIFPITQSNFKEFSDIKTNSKILQESTLPFILEDSTLFPLISPPSVPFVMWIDESGRLVATSKGSSLTKENVSKFIRGEKLGFFYGMISEPKGKKQTTKSCETMRKNDSIIYFSSLQKQNSLEYFPSTRYRRNSKEGLGIEIIEGSLESILCLAYNFPFPQYIATNDQDLEYIIKPRQKDLIEDWKQNTTYNYRLIFEPNKYYPNEHQVLCSCIQKDLLEILNIKGIKRKKVTPSFHLKSISNTLKVESKDVTKSPVVENTKKGIFIRNKTMTSLATHLEHWINRGNPSNFVPVIDKTEIKKLLDIELNFTNASVQSINKSLKEFGLKLVPEMEEIEYLFLEKDTSKLAVIP